MKRPYVIAVSGCEGDTEITVHLANHAAALLQEVAQQITEAAKISPQPTMSIREVPAEDVDPLASVRVGDSPPRRAGVTPCDSMEPGLGWGYLCTRERDHPGKHIASTLSRVAATRTDEPSGGAT